MGVLAQIDSRRCVVDVLGVFCGCTGGVLWVYWECFVGVMCAGNLLWLSRRCVVGVLGVFCGCPGGVL